MFRVVGLFVGFGFSVLGGITFVAYLNLFTVGFSFMKYVLFMALRLESYLFFAGIGMIWLAIYYPGKNEDEEKNI
ncbi:hypothetical protein JSY36_10175 [Bacillus sp. H-16]|uniref:hypothetical protein n=1 Tax=Alteribacter salitolerans TaxID=2912333 RepID=UPI001963D187|nr:hypothetical protein [Alteribacter salitolerans]MBM7096123.1 hypothetical protein [Alteribacter salitolerans]